MCFKILDFKLGDKTIFSVLENSPLETEATIFMKEASFESVFPCNSYSRACKVKVSFSSHFLISSPWSHRYNHGMTCGVYSLYLLSWTENQLLLIAEMLVHTEERITYFLRVVGPPRKISPQLKLRPTYFLHIVRVDQPIHRIFIPLNLSTSLLLMRWPMIMLNSVETFTVWIVCFWH